MKKNLILIIAAAAIIALCAPERLMALTAMEIIDRAEKSIRGDSQIAMIEITIKTRRWTRTMEMKNRDNRVAKKSFAEILSPEEGRRQPLPHDQKEKLCGTTSRRSARRSRYIPP